MPSPFSLGKYGFDCKKMAEKSVKMGKTHVEF